MRAITIVTSVLLACPVAGAPPSRMVTEGLELWLDAARPLGDQHPPSDQAVLEVWQDLSGHGRHVRQANDACRPRFVKVGPDAVVRFDGDNDHLRCVGATRAAENFTIILVAAPRANLGGFHGMFSTNAPQRRDYESGINVDFGPDGSAVFDQLNVEGRGFQGARNLLTDARPYGPLHTIEVHGSDKSVRVAINNVMAGDRPRQPGAISLAEMTVGARFYTNSSAPQEPRGFYAGDFAEILVYSRSLSKEELTAVRQHLEAKHARLKAAIVPLNRGTTLARVTNPPAVQVLVPGFTVRPLPLDLPNINNIRYRPDGKLLALCYNGDAYLLSDTDGDGLEDKAELFWDNQGRLISPIGMDLTPPGYQHGDGFFVAAKGKVSIIVDTDKDGKADKEIVIAEGWPATTVSVDAVGVAFDRHDGSVYFGLGCANFANAYLTDKDGKGKYSKDSERGTIMRVKPDLKSRETICTGIRFPVGMAFNRLGDLFAADQEGATWLANGNPFDEFLHIEKGRHYGFPPRHPQHNPSVIDEPSVYDYGPQHQCTCGFYFNESVNGGPGFGPAGWVGNAIVTGESRGKLYRTELVKSSSGYVARNQIIACTNMLTIDACGTPDGGMVIACHSGKPDWGTGPSGKGKLFKITYAEKAAPQPVAVWPAGPREVRVAFDRPLDLEPSRNLATRATLWAGKYVRAGDRFESFWPGYQVVQMQLLSPRYPVPVRSVQLSPDRRTLILATDTHAESLHFALTLPRGETPTQNGAVKQVPDIDLDYDLSGVEARWQPKSGPTWSGWLPHCDLQVAREFTRGSAAHDRLWQSAQTVGELTLRTQLNLANMLRPAVQPGARVEYAWPDERVTLSLRANGPLHVACKVGAVETAGNRATVILPANYAEPVAIEIRVTAANPTLDVSYGTNEDSRPRALPLRRILLPWAQTKADAFETAAAPAPAPELAGGSWARGHKLFFDDKVGCAKCHAVHGRGSSIGPDLSNLLYRDYASVYRDITEPNAALNPDHLSYSVHVADGRTLTGTVRTEGDRLIVGDQQGKETALARVDVEKLQPLPLSTMPEDLAKTLGPDRLRDVMTFLMTAPRMPVYAKGVPPPARTRAEVRSALAGTPDRLTIRPLKVVLVSGAKDHGTGEHDYPAWQKVWAELLAAGDQTTVSTARDWPAAEQLAQADVLVFFQYGDWNEIRARDLDMFLERGGGAVYIHWAVSGRQNAPGFANRIGLASSSRGVAFRHGPLDLDFRPGAGHPITRNVAALKLVDESYWNMIGDLTGATVLANAIEDKQPRPQIWIKQRGQGRIFVCIPGHYSWTFDDPLYRLLLLRGIAWTAKEPVDRFNDLVWPGARVAE